jgi:hypothetical protein
MESGMLGAKQLQVFIAAGVVCFASTSHSQAQVRGAGEFAWPAKAAQPAASERGPLMADLPIESPAAQFARAKDPERLYEVSMPEWADRQPDWIEPHKMIAATAFEDLPHKALIGPTPPPSSFWERWRHQRLERRQRPSSWFRYPFYFEKFTSVIRTDEPIHNQIHNGRGNLFGARLGWDFAPRWGIEARLGYLRSTMKDAAHPLPPPHENFLFCDTTALFYLTGDTRWRPFVEVGFGLVQVGFIDDQSVRWNQTLLTAPFGTGLKFRISDHNALRFEVLDNMVFGNGHGGNSRPTHDLAVSFAFERRFGKPHPSYFPQNDCGYWTRCRQWWDSMSN